MNFIEIIETRDVSMLPSEEWLARIVHINGFRHLQMQGMSHPAMKANWEDGVLMRIGDCTTLDDVAADPETFYRGFGKGSEICDVIPPGLRI